MKPVCVLLLLTAPALLAQTKKTVPAPKPRINRTVERITSVQVTGSKLYSSAELTPLTGIRTGVPLNRAELDTARAKLLETKLFAEVNYEYKTAVRGNAIDATVTFEVTDYPERYAIRFDRLGKLDAELYQVLREKVPLYREPLPYSPMLIDQVKEALAAVTGPVDVRMTNDLGPEPFLLIHPAGRGPVIAEVRFKGGEVISNDDLTFAMRAAAVGREYREPMFRELLKLGAVPLYEAKGRVRVAFPKIEVEQPKGVPGYLITVTVEEGPTYTVSGYTVEGVDGDRMKRDLARAASLKEGDLANMEEVKAAQGKMEAHLKRAGFLDVKSSVERKIDDAKHEIALVFRMEPGEQYTMGRLTLRGLDILSEPQIKKMWGMDPGKAFNVEYPEAFLSRIKEQRMFDNLKSTRAITNVNRETHVVDVTLEFK
jgi:outer membrane protein assembly factor BamA